VTIGHRTNAIYRELVEQALDLQIDTLRLDGVEFGDCQLAQAFGGDAGILRQLRALRGWNASAQHYTLGAYHNALLYAVLPGEVECMNDMHSGEQPMVFGDGRYLIMGIDVGALVENFFADVDFALPKERINQLLPAEKVLLGLDDAVFGVANALQPHPEELLPRRGSPHAVATITELTTTAEDHLRRRVRVAPDAVWEEIAAMGPLYRRGAVFPYWPAWLGDAVGFGAYG